MAAWVRGAWLLGGDRPDRGDSVGMTRQHESVNQNTEHSMVGDVVGGKRVVRELARHGLARRFLGHDLRRRIDCLLYVFDREAGQREPTWNALRLMVGQNRPHALRIEEIGRERGGWCWACAPYPGNHETIVTLAGLRKNKGGRFSPHETARAIEQVFDLVSSAHSGGLTHGVISEDEIVVNPSGSLFVELYGLRQRLDRSSQSDESAHDEVRSVVGLAWTLLTGVDASEWDVFAERAGRTVDRRWMQWIERGLDPIMGFKDAGEAVAAMPDNNPVGVEFPAGGARGLFGRLSSAVAPRKEIGGLWSRKKQGPGGV